VTLEYFNVITNKFELVTNTCYVKRSRDTDKNQKRDSELDKQINRLTAAAAMEAAQQIGRDDLVKARQIISDAISQIKRSISGSDPFSVELVEDLADILSDMKDSSSYEKKAAKKMVWKGEAHKKQRAVGAAGASYQTKSKTEMQSKAVSYEKEMNSDKKKVSSPRKPVLNANNDKKSVKSPRKSESDSDDDTNMVSSKVSKKTAPSKKEKQQVKPTISKSPPSEKKESANKEDRKKKRLSS